MRTIAVLVVLLSLVACGGGSPAPVPEPPSPVTGKALATWSAVDSHYWTIEAWQPGGTPETDVILWTGELQGPGKISHEFTVSTWERIRFRYTSGNRVGADQHSLVGPGSYEFTISPRFSR